MNFTKALLFVCCYSSILHGQLCWANEEQQENKKKLESLKIHVKEAEQERKLANDEKRTLNEELKQSEVQISELAKQIKQLKDNLEQKQQKLQALKREEAEQRQQLSQEREILATQIRAAFIDSRTDHIKLFLNQEQPEKISRVMAYYDYQNRSRIELIESAMAKLQALVDLEKSIEQESLNIAKLQTEQEQQLQEFAEIRKQRQTILLRLDQYIAQKDKELQSLHAEIRELGKLLSKLKQQDQPSVNFFEDLPPFRSMRGKMAWPVNGKIVQTFGQPKKGEDLRWNGVLINASTGTDIKAINNGRVIFADWFKNLGMLIILDHGNDYMSLYAHNQSLYKQTGDWVLAGETIASVGDSGGQNQPGLYFEIRHNGKPVNPGLWCKR